MVVAGCAHVSRRVQGNYASRSRVRPRVHASNIEAQVSRTVVHYCRTTPGIGEKMYEKYPINVVSDWLWDAS